MVNLVYPVACIICKDHIGDLSPNQELEQSEARIFVITALCKGCKEKLD